MAALQDPWRTVAHRVEPIPLRPSPFALASQRAATETRAAASVVHVATAGSSELSADQPDLQWTCRPTEVPWAHELLGEACRRQEDLDQAEHHLRRCIETADERRNGTTKVTGLSLGDVLLEQGRVEEAGQILAAQEPRWLA